MAYVHGLRLGFSFFAVVAFASASSACGGGGGDGDGGPPPPSDGGTGTDGGGGDTDGGSGDADGGSGDGSCSVTVDDSGELTDTCSTDEICVCPGGDLECADGTCGDPFDRRYTIALSSVELPERKPSGDCWDATCGAPDPFVDISVDGTLLGTAPTRDDTYTAEWDPAYTVEATIIAGSSITFDVFDEDFSDHDGALQCEGTANAELLRGRGLVCDGELGMLVATVVPR